MESEMKVLVLLMLLTFGCIAKDDVQFKPSTLDNTKSIYWINSESNSAVLYSRFKVFHNLRDLVSTTIITANETAQTSETFCSYDKLVFVDNNKDLITVFSIKNNSIIHNGIIYAVPEQQLGKFTDFNQKRIAKGDGVLAKHLKMNINNYSEECL
jgi:hypothetical protein